MADMDVGRLESFERDLRAAHAKLFAEYTELHAQAEAVWATYQAKSLELEQFRGRYGKVLQSLDGGGLKAGGITAAADVTASAVAIKAGKK